MGKHKDRLKIDWDLVGRYLEAHCTGAQVAAFLGIHRVTLYDKCQEDHGITFQEFMDEKRDRGKATILGTQYKQACRGDRSMLVWLGKNWCGQRDSHDIKVEGELNIKVVNFGDDQNPTPYKDKED